MADSTSSDGSSVVGDLANIGIDAAGSTDVGHKLMGAVQTGVNTAEAAAATATGIAGAAVLLGGTAAASAAVAIVGALGITATALEAVPIIGTIAGAIVGIVAGIIALATFQSDFQQHQGVPQFLYGNDNGGRRSQQEIATTGMNLVRQAAAVYRKNPGWEPLWPAHYLSLAQGESNYPNEPAGQPGSYKDALAQILDDDYTIWLIKQPNWQAGLVQIQKVAPWLYQDIVRRLPDAFVTNAVIPYAPQLQAMPFVSWATYQDIRGKVITQLVPAGVGVVNAAIAALPSNLVTFLNGVVVSPTFGGTAPVPTGAHVTGIANTLVQARNATNAGYALGGPNANGPSSGAIGAPLPTNLAPAPPPDPFAAAIAATAAGGGHAGGTTGITGTAASIGAGMLPGLGNLQATIAAMSKAASTAFNANPAAGAANALVYAAAAGNQAAQKTVLGVVSSARAGSAAATTTANVLTTAAKLQTISKYVGKYFGTAIAQQVQSGANISVNHATGT